MQSRSMGLNVRNKNLITGRTFQQLIQIALKLSKDADIIERLAGWLLMSGSQGIARVPFTQNLVLSFIGPQTQLC